MRTQTPISLRIDDNLLGKLDRLCEITGDKRNRLINRAIETFLRLDEMNDNYRVRAIVGSDDKQSFCREALKYHFRELPEFLQW